MLQLSLTEQALIPKRAWCPHTGPENSDWSRIEGQQLIKCFLQQQKLKDWVPRLICELDKGSKFTSGSLCRFPCVSLNWTHFLLYFCMESLGRLRVLFSWNSYWSLTLLQENPQLLRLHHILLTVLCNFRECAENPESPLISPQRQQSRRGGSFSRWSLFPELTG